MRRGLLCNSFQGIEQTDPPRLAALDILSQLALCCAHADFPVFGHSPGFLAKRSHSQRNILFSVSNRNLSVTSPAGSHTVFRSWIKPRKGSGRALTLAGVGVQSSLICSVHVEPMGASRFKTFYPYRERSLLVGSGSGSKSNSFRISFSTACSVEVS